MSTATQQEVQSAALALIERAGSIAVTNDDDYKAAAAIRTQEISPALKELDRIFDPSIDAAKRSLEVARLAKAEFYGPLEARGKNLKTLMDQYLNEKARRQREEEARKAAEVRRQQEEERLKAALAAEAAGKADEVEQILEAPAPVVAVRPVTAAAVAPPVAGITGRRVWKYRVVDRAKVKPEYMLVDDAKIGKDVRAFHKDAEQMVGGIEAYEEIVT